MKNNLEMMTDIREETYKQIEFNLPSNEFLITSLTIYDKNNSLAVNLFLTNTAIFMQESNEVERIKKRTFIKIVDIKLTSDEFYIEFQNGYKIIGDTKPCQNAANNFFECIKANTTIKTSSSKELENETFNIPEVKEVPRYNPFGHTQVSKIEEVEEPKEPAYVRTLTDDNEYENSKTKEKKKSKVGLFVGIGIGAVALLTTIIVLIVVLVGGKKEEVDPQILAIQNRAQELLNYQVDNNELYDYLFDLTGYYEEYEAGFSSQTKLDVEKEFSNKKTAFESKYSNKKYESSAQVYKVYEVKKIDSWMNENVGLMSELFELYEEIIDEDYRDDSNIVSLQTKLTNADTKINKTRDCLEEEKDALNALLGNNDSSNTNTPTKNKEDNGEEEKPIAPQEPIDEVENNVENPENSENTENNIEENIPSENQNTTTTTKPSTSKPQTTKKPDDGFSYENESSNKDDSQKNQGRQDKADYISE